MSNIVAPVTPNRRTHVIFDCDEWVVSIPAFSNERQAEEMCRGTASTRKNVELRKGVGWTLTHYFDKLWYMAERTEGAAGFLSQASGNLSVAANISETNRYGAPNPTKYPGLSPGGSLLAGGFPFQRKDVSQTSGDWSTAVLSSDQSSYPGATSANTPSITADESFPLDRVAISTSSYGVDGVIFGPFVFVFDLYGVQHSGPDTICAFYCPGPAGSNSDGDGNGQYEFKFYGNGKAELFENLGSRADGSAIGWVSRTKFRYAEPGHVWGFFHRITVFGTPTPTVGGPGGSISIGLGSSAAGTNLVSFIAGWAVHTLTGHEDSESTFTYAVPATGKSSVMAASSAIRVDVRRDLRGVFFTLAVPQFLSDGYFTDDPIADIVPMKGGGTAIYYLEWDASLPPGTAIDGRLYTADGTALTVVSTSSTGNTFTVPDSTADSSNLQLSLQWHFSTSNPVVTPILRARKIYRDGVILLNSGAEWEVLPFASSGSDELIQESKNSVSIVGQERDPSHESASVNIDDISGTGYSPLHLRASMPFRIETEYDAADSSKRVVLHRGYVDRVFADRKGWAESTYPGPNWNTLSVHGNGMWQRLREQFYRGVQQALYDYSTGKPFFVNDVITAFLEYSGWASSDINLDPSMIRTWPLGTSNANIIDPLANIAETIKKLIDTYLGYFLHFDANLGTYGTWRTIAPPSAPYVNVAAFVSGSPNTGVSGDIMTHQIGAYPIATSGSGLLYTPTAPTSYILKGTDRSWVIPPEGNLVHVSCSATVNVQGVNLQGCATVINPKSYNFDPAHPTADRTNPDFLNREIPIFYMDPGIGASAGLTEAQLDNLLNWVARRIYDVACHAIKMRSFQTPLIFVKHELDASRMRPLRFYDPVTVDSFQYLVRNCNPAYSKDSQQMMMLELEVPNF